MKKKFSNKNKLTNPKKLAAAGRALETRLETWLGRVRKRTSRNEQRLAATVERVKKLENKVRHLETLVQALQSQRGTTP